MLTANQKPGKRVLTAARFEPIMKWRGFSRLEATVRFPVPHITAIMLLAHVVLGCCWHHSHRCVASERTPAPESTTSCHAGDHVHSEAEHDPHDHNQGLPYQHHCDGDRCSFLPSEPSPMQAGMVYFAPCFLDLTFLPTSSQLTRPRFHHSQDPSLHNGGLPVRAHLLLGVLLI